MKPRAGRWLALAGLALGCATAQADEVCTNTNFASPFMTGCAGAFAGQLVGAASELAALQAIFGVEFSYAGRSDDPVFGPFTTNPQVAFNGTLSFDTPETGVFVLGLASAGQYSLYRFTTKRRIGSLDFDSLEGVATTPQGNPFALDYAALYRATPVPEPAAALTLGAGALALVGWHRRRRIG